MKKIILLFLISFNAYADWATSLAPHIAPYSEKIKPLVQKYLGDDLANRLFPPVTGQITMPPIPKLNLDATSTKEYENPENDMKLKPEDEEKYNISFLYELFKVTRLKEATDEEIQRWMNTLSQGGTREGVYRAVVLDSTYAEMESYQDKPSENAVIFAKEFLEKYVGQQVKDGTLESFNFFSLKRICAEKALEILDEYGANKDHRSNWYALLSTDMAKHYPQAFRAGLRQSLIPEQHKSWANAVPFQHIKSETILKMHLVFNYLKN